MSRTYKDRPWRVRFPKIEEYDYTEYELVTPYVCWSNKIVTHRKYITKRAGVLVKKPRRKDTEHHWMTTPAWWVHMFMTRPERVRANRETTKIKHMPLDQLDLVDVADLKKKPHVYFW